MAKRHIPTLDQVQVVAESFITEPILNIKRVSIADSITFEVQTEAGEYFLRASGEELNYDLEHQILSLVRSHGVKAPKPIAANIDLYSYPFSFSLQTKVSGTALDLVPDKKWPKILKQVGGQLAKCYLISLKGFGSLDKLAFRKNGSIRGMYKSWYEYLSQTLKEQSEEIKRRIAQDKAENFVNSKLTKPQRLKVVEIADRVEEAQVKLKKMKPKLNLPGVLGHGDIHSEHIFQNKGQLTGIIDWNDAFVTDPLYEIAYFSVMPKGFLYPYLLEGSGVTFDSARFHLYRMVLAIEKIHTRYIRKDYLHEYPEVLDIALEELNKHNF